jgi:HlyD family secretion protein
MRRTAPASPTAGSIRRHLLAAAAAIALLVGGVGGWAATTEFSGAVIAPGNVVVESHVKKVQHPTGGVVGELKVRDGDRVKAGDVVVRLDDTQTRASLAIVTKALDELQARQARLEAERDGAETIAFPQELLDRSPDEPVLARVLQGEARLFEVRRASRSGQVAQLRQRIAQLGDQITGIQEQLDAKKREIAFIETELKGVRDLYRQNLTPIQRVTVLERDAARLTGEHGALVASVAQARARITETELQILQIEQDLRTEVGRDLAEIRGKTSELVERRIAAEDQLRRIDIRAPQDGVVHQLALHTVGGVAAPGEALMLVVPESDELSIEVKIPPESIDQLRVGQRAVLRFSAFNQRTTPEILGFLSRISADLTVDQRTGLSFYTARIGITGAEMARLGHRLIPGMPVESFIQTGDRTVLSYFTKPLTDQMQRAFRER